MSHQLQGPRAGLIAPEFDNAFLERLAAGPEGTDELRGITRLDFLREAGTEGIELIMWLIMRAAMGRDVDELHRFYHVPASNTAVGHVVMKPKRQFRHRLGEVEARKQAVVSANSALEATQAGFEVGTRTIVDVLLSQRQLYQAQRDLSQARHSFVLNQLLLRQSAGNVGPNDLKEVNALLE